MAFPYVTGEESRIQNRKTIIKVIKNTTVIGNGIEDVKTVEELRSKILPENEGKLYKYVGESSDGYEKFAIYQVYLQAGESNKLIQKGDENILIKSDINNSAKDIVLSIDGSLNSYRDLKGTFEVLYTITSDEDSIVPNLSVMQDYSSKFDTYNVDKIYFKTIQIPVQEYSYPNYIYKFKNRLCAYGNVRNSGETICIPLITSLSIADQFGFTISEDSIQSTQPGNVFSVERTADGSIITNIEKKITKSIDIYIEQPESDPSTYDKFILVEENKLLLGYQTELSEEYPTAPDFYSHIVHSCLNEKYAPKNGVMIGSGWYRANIPTVGKVDYINPLVENKNIFTASDLTKPEYKLIKIK